MREAAEAAYSEFVKSKGGATEHTPSWDVLPDSTKDAWHAVAALLSVTATEQAERRAACCTMNIDGHHCDCVPCGRCTQRYQEAKRRVHTEVQRNGVVRVRLEGHVETITLDISIDHPPPTAAIAPRTGETT
jgi:hypothetical protein